MRPLNFTVRRRLGGVSATVSAGSNVSNHRMKGDPARLIFRLSFHRKLFLWTHGVLAFLSMFVYIDRLALRVTPFLPTGSRRLIFLAMPALWPYLVSSVASWQFVSDRRIATYLFLIALVTCGLVSIALALGAFGVVTDKWSLLRIYFIQTAAHYLISWLLDIGADRGNG